MAPHPSLSAAFIQPPDLRPQRKMARNELCWCGSGHKWKHCHCDRELQPRVNVWQLVADTRAEFTKGYCSHPAAGPATCGGKIVRAHTIQRSGGLAAIAESGHVISMLSGAQNIFRNDGRIEPREVGIGHASTFMGFCDYHDGTTFRPAESADVALTQESCFVLGFRALSYELFTKRAALRNIEIQREMDKGAPFEIQVAIQRYLHVYATGLRRGIKDLLQWKNKYDAALLANRFAAYTYCGFVFKHQLPFACCGAIHPEFDFEGRALQKLGRDVAPYDFVTLNVTVLDGKSVAVFVWETESNGPAQEFVESFVNIPNGEKAEALARLAFEHFENLHAKPSWWATLPPATRAAAIQRIRSGGPASNRRADCLLADGHFFMLGSNIESVVRS